MYAALRPFHVTTDAAAEEESAGTKTELLWISGVRSFVRSYVRWFVSPYAEETQSHGKLSAKNTAYRGDAADDATGGGVPRFKMKNRGHDVFSKVRSNAPLARDRHSREKNREVGEHTGYIMHGVAASCASGVPSAKR